MTIKENCGFWGYRGTPAVIFRRTCEVQVYGLGWHLYSGQRHSFKLFNGISEHGVRLAFGKLKMSRHKDFKVSQET